jgi:hypothetical protein
MKAQCTIGLVVPSPLAMPMVPLQVPYMAIVQMRRRGDTCRSAKTGHFVSASYAWGHKSTR